MVLLVAIAHIASQILSCSVELFIEGSVLQVVSHTQVHCTLALLRNIHAAIVHLLLLQPGVVLAL